MKTNGRWTWAGGAIAGLALAMSLTTAVMAQDAPKLKILISQSPWLNSFIALVDKYQEETGTVIELDVTPFGGMLEKTRNSVRGDTGNYDIVNLNSTSLAEIYSGGFLKPLKEIDADFTLPEGVLDFGSSAYWNAGTNSFDPNGELLGVPTNGNVQVLYYRADLYEEAGLNVPETWNDLLANAKALHNPPAMYGFVPRAARDSILYNFTPYLFSHGATFFANAEAGDYSVTLNSPEGLQALETYIGLGKEAGPPNPGAIAQAELIQLLATGKAAQAIAVVAAMAELDNPDSSVVAGKIRTALLPAGPGGQRASAAGHWIAGIPKNIPEDNQKAAMDFLKWFVGKDVQVAYVQAAGVPVRDDLADTALAEDESFHFIEAFSANAKVARMNMPLKEGTMIKDAISVHLNRAVIGEMSPKDALNAAAAEMHEILSAAGYKLTPPGKL